MTTASARLIFSITLNLLPLTCVLHDKSGRKGQRGMHGRLGRAHSELLVIRIRRGETQAFSDLVEMWEKRLFYFVRRLVWHEEDAWDVLQETWMKVHARIGQLRDPSAFPAWIFRIARHTAVSHLRKMQRCELLREDDSQQEIPDGPTDRHGFSEAEAERVHWGLDQLPLPQREALTLFFLEDFSLDEIAHVTRVSAGTIKSRLHYGKKKLRDIIEREDDVHE